MRKAFLSLIIAGVVIPILAACARDQQQQPAQPYQSYPPGQAYPNQYPASTYPQQTAAPGYTNPPPAATTAPPATNTGPFPFPIPSNLPAMIPSGLIPGWPAPTST